MSSVDPSHFRLPRRTEMAVVSLSPVVTPPAGQGVAISDAANPAHLGRHFTGPSFRSDFNKTAGNYTQKFRKRVCCTYECPLAFNRVFCR